MRMARDRDRGFTLVELLVVMAILAILGVLAVPAFLSMMPSEDLSSASRELYTTLQWARAYAATHRVNTAVVYSLDNFVPISLDPQNNATLPEPIMDSGTGQFMRVITHVAVMRQLPPSAGLYSGRYVPVDGVEGQFRQLPGDTVVLLNDPEAPFNPYYVHKRPRVAPPDDANDVQQVYRLGMSIIDAYLEGTGPDGENRNPTATTPFIAHVFKPSGALHAPDSPERVTLHVAPRPDAPVEDRYDDAATLAKLRTVPLELYRSTGRARIRDTRLDEQGT
ncbi:MAG TPA: prepilin-type N-terminal cleavage/methylation domain-containing protein [Candidatus Hydrogenedentes bacterium]|nr:prepilin-type N-terminal cleavage/methylation domain-containing protein [Candidatus Hydrogenedentota bacterium]HNT86267.1 prepilin-type N-terminal cleavage/methylation domain-containing protein [Candidatus Hydrogenedentota bacterium]